MPIISDADCRPSGFSDIGNIPWGSHLCQFYRGKSDLIDALVPFFQAGLEANERCLWITSDPLVPAEAHAALKRAVPDLDERERRGQIEILDYREWYTKGGGAEDILRGWLDAEAAALADGYDGLRISGNTFWLEHKDWDGFAAYEASVHRAFHERRIIALCSYALGKCSANDIIDVLRNHGFALVRRDGRWESIQSATQMLAANGEVDETPVYGSIEEAQFRETSGVPAGQHAVRFFEEPGYPAADIAQYLHAGLAQGRAVLVFAAQRHIEDITAALAAHGHDVAALIEAGQVVARDAEWVVETVRIDGALDEATFDRAVAAEVRRAIGRFGRARIYGEIVDVLARAGDHAAAVQLERWWNQLLAADPVELLCGYALDGFADARSVSAFRRICRQHAAIEPVPGEGYGDRGRLVAELQQATVALRTESRQRHQLERQQSRLREAESASRVQAHLANRHLACLQQLTSAISEAATPAEIGRAVATSLERVFGADIAAVALAIDGGKKLLLLGHANLTPRQAEALQVTAADAPLPIAAAYRTRSPVWLRSSSEIARAYPAVLEAIPDVQAVSALPLILRGRPVGSIVLLYKIDYEDGAPRRALLEDYVKQVALAVERAKAHEEAQRARTRLQILADAGARIARARLDLKQIMDTIVHEVTHAEFADGCAVNLCDENGKTLSLAALHHADAGRGAALERLLRTTPIVIGEGIVGNVAKTGRAVRTTTREEALDQARAAYRGYFEEHPISSLIAVPLRASGKIIGTLTASRALPSPSFNEEDERLVHDLADRAALAIENGLLYERAQRERERAESANRAKDEFLAMLGHELRNPLSPMLTASQLMRLRGGDMLLKERSIIERQVNHMVRLVDDLLDVSRIARGKIDLKRVPIELSQVVADAVEITSPLLEERRHNLATSIPVAGLLVEADASRLSQAVANLLSNAAKYTPRNGLIELKATSRDGKVALHVKDNGAGIERDLLPRIFDLFAQGKQESDRSVGGLGLGLTIARSLAEKHDGTLRVESDGPGKGSEFILELPLVGGQKPPAASQPAPAAAGIVSGQKILVVDDNADAAESLGELLQMLGYVVQVTHDGPSALRLAEKFQPDIALLDIGLPAMDGYTLGQRLQALLYHAPPKLVAITGYGQAADRRRSKAAGFDRHLVKPVDFERLQAVISGLSAAIAKPRCS